MGAASRARDELRERVLAGELTPMQAAELAPRWGRLREPDGLFHDVPLTAAEQAPGPAAGTSAGRREGWAGAAAQATWWPVDAQVLADAVDQARPFTGDTTAQDRAWSARVDAAVAGMDALDRQAMDQWMATHADSSTPHLEEAGLVAAFETWLANEYTDDPTTADTADHAPTADHAAQAEPADEAQDVVQDAADAADEASASDEAGEDLEDGWP